MRWWIPVLAGCVVVGAVARADIPELGAAPAHTVEVGQGNVDDLVRHGSVDELARLARTSPDSQVRGWAIVGLSQVGGARADRVLSDLTAPGEPALVQTWAAAAKIARARSMTELRELASLRGRLPALDRPLRLRIEALASSASVEELLALSQDGALAPAVAPLVMGAPTGQLVRIMFEHPDDAVRRQAAAFLASKGQQGEQDAVAAEVLAMLAIPRSRSARVPWEGGALFIPGLQWRRAEARTLVKTLIAWWLWLDTRGRQAETRPVWNNLYSVGLLSQAGYDRNLQANPESLVNALARVEGRAGARAVLEQVGLAGDPRFRDLGR